MRPAGLAHLGGEAQRPAVGHQVVARHLAGLGIQRQGQPRLGIHLEAGGQDVFEVGDRARAAEHRDGRRGGVQSPAGAGVAAGRIAHDLEGEVRLHGPATEVARRPGPGDADQALVQQQGMRGALALREVGTVGAIGGGEQRVLAAGLLPPRLGRGGREAHGVGRLVAGDAGPAIGAQGLEERMAPGRHRPVREQQPQVAGGIVVVELGGEHPPFARRPPALRRRRAQPQAAHANRRRDQSGRQPGPRPADILTRHGGTIAPGLGISPSLTLWSRPLPGAALSR